MSYKLLKLNNKLTNCGRHPIGMEIAKYELRPTGHDTQSRKLDTEAENVMKIFKKWIRVGMVKATRNVDKNLGEGTQLYLVWYLGGLGAVLTYLATVQG